MEKYSNKNLEHGDLLQSNFLKTYCMLPKYNYNFLAAFSWKLIFKNRNEMWTSIYKTIHVFLASLSKSTTQSYNFDNESPNNYVLILT